MSASEVALLTLIFWHSHKNQQCTDELRQRQGKCAICHWMAGKTNFPEWHCGPKFSCSVRTHIIGHQGYASGSTAFILISACYPICKKNEIISPRQTNHLSNCSATPDWPPHLPPSSEPSIVQHSKGIKYRLDTSCSQWSQQPMYVIIKRWSYAHTPRH